MALEWVKCTLADHDETVVRVNLSNASLLTRLREKTRIAFVGHADDFVDVKETPEELLNLLENGEKS